MNVNIPGYAIIKPIGEGGMATVYLAYQHNLERHVALKVLDPSLAAQADFCDRFLREAKIGASLSHRNIVPVFDIGCFEPYHYLAMEYLPNGDFKRRVATGCDTGTALRIIYDVACALSYAHTKGYVHRDIKPENIMFREDQTAVLTDFGIALDMKADAGPGDGLIVGSPQYMSPEQARSDSLDCRSDIYSLGAVLFEALARRPLLDTAATVADAVRHSTDPLPRLPAEVSWLQPVLAKMLAKDPKGRFADMAEVVRALEPCLKVSDSLQGMSRQRVVDPGDREPGDREPGDREPPAPERRYSRVDTGMRAERPLSRSAPTLIVDASDDLSSALANCPPVPGLGVAAAPPPQRSRVGILLLLVVLAAAPLVWLQWPALMESAPMLADLSLSRSAEQSIDQATDPSAELQSPRYTGVIEERPLPMPADADSAPLASSMDDPATGDSSQQATARPGTASAAAPATASAPTTTATGSAPQAAPSEIATADTSEPEPDPVAQLLQQADEALQGASPGVPEVTSAYEKFSKVLSLDPRNKVAREGLGTVAARYLELASRALNQDKLDSAQEYVDRASTIATRHRLGFQVSQRINDLQQVLNRIRNLDEQKESWS